jgi:Peptidase S24-like.
VMVRWGLVRVTGRSMLPTLRDGDLLVIDRRRAPRAGDMAVVRLPPDWPR